MKLDTIDLKIISTIYQAIHNGELNEKMSTTYIAKKVYDTDGDEKLSNLDAKVNHRLKKLAKYGIVEVDEGDIDTFTLKTNEVIFGETKLEVDTMLNGREEHYEFDTEGMLFVKNEQGFYGFTYIPVPEDKE